MRSITVNEITVPISDDMADVLNKRELVYPCGDGHDLHLQPDFPEDLDLDDLENLVTGIAEGYAEQEASVFPEGKSLIDTIHMKSIMTPDSLAPLSPKSLEDRKAYVARNLALNIATTLQRTGFFKVSERTIPHGAEGAGNIEITTQLTVVNSPAALAFAAKTWLVDKVMADETMPLDTRKWMSNYLKAL